MERTTLGRRIGLTLALSLGAAAAWPQTADAFCGFYVSGADGQLFADATQVVLMRDGTRTALSMQNDYKGPPEDFALVIPVPVVLQKENVKTLAPDVFRRIDLLSAPRLVEYWEQDPCPTGIGLGEIGTIGHGGGTGTGQGFGAGAGRLKEAAVKVEAQFEVGEYEIVILSAKDSSALDTWLRANRYKIPENAEPALKPYVQAGSKFFVAKVNAAKVKFEGGRATLSPLRFYYDTDKFELPVKLGLLNSGGTQDLIVHILAAERYEVANRANVTIPTNLDVTEAAREKFGTFYATLFDDTVKKTPRAAVTEYAWQATNCDPCPGGTSGLSGQDLVTLGADVMPKLQVNSFGGGSWPTIRQGATTVNGRLPPEVVQRILRQQFGRFRNCYQSGLKRNPTLSGRVAVKFTISAKGEVVTAADSGSTLPAPDVVSCVVKSVQRATFPEPEDHKTVSVVFPLLFQPGPAGSSVRVGFAGGQNGLTLTRLHVRYDKDSLGDDLVFRAAEPIVGGRETWTDGKLASGATKTSGSSSFQGRYAIRHPWPGKIDCKEPRRGVWGARWRNLDGGADEPPVTGPTAVPASKLAYADRNASLASFTTLSAADLTATPLGAPATAAGDAGSAQVADAGAQSQSPPARSSSCGCRVEPRRGASDVLGVLGVLGVAMLRRARR